MSERNLSGRVLQPANSPGKRNPHRQSVKVPGAAPAVIPGTRRDPTLKEKNKNTTRHRPTTYRDHSTRPTVIPAYALPRASWALLAALPWRLVHTFILADYITRRGLGRVHMGRLAALRGISARGLQYHMEELEALGLIAIIENRVSYDWCEANTFIFLEDKSLNRSPLFSNCILPAVALKTKTIYTKNQPMKGKEKAKTSHREKMESIWKANHPPGKRIDWYQRRKQRNKLNWQPHVKEAYEAQGVVWAAVDTWRKANPHRVSWRPLEPAKSEAQKQWEREEMARRAAMTEQQRGEEDAAMEEFARKWHRRQRAESADIAELAAPATAARWKQQTTPACERCGDYGRIQVGKKGWGNCPDCEAGKRGL